MKAQLRRHQGGKAAGETGERVAVRGDATADGVRVGSYDSGRRTVDMKPDRMREKMVVSMDCHIREVRG
jgi:hypothetical protein